MMRYVIIRLLVPAVAIALPVAAEAQLRRSPGTGTDRPERGTPPAVISKNPYAGSWEGTITRGEESSSPARMSATFSVTDENKHTYSGTTRIGEASSRQALSITAVSSGPTIPAATGGSASGTVARRSPGGAKTSESGPNAGSAEQELDMGSAATVLLVRYHTGEPLMCGNDGRCGDMPKLKWEEKGPRGTLVYRGLLVSPDSIRGSITRREATGNELAAGTFALTRRR